MVRSFVVFVFLAAAGLFTYFFVTDRSDRRDSERASDALRKVGDTAMDQGMAGAIKGRLAVAYGLEGSRFLHTWFDNGKVLVYGFAPADVTNEQIVGRVLEMPGVREVEVLVLPRPAYLDEPSPTASHATVAVGTAVPAEAPPARTGGPARKGK